MASLPKPVALCLLLLIGSCTAPGDGARAAGQAAPPPPPAEADPPRPMIDFLGRRKNCADYAPDPDEPEPPPHPDSWLAWLRCGDLAAEEAELRRRYRADAAAIAHLDQPPEKFRLSEIVVRSYDGPPAARVEQAQQSGTDAEGRTRWRVILDGTAGSATAVTASWEGMPTRTVHLDHGLFPNLDLGTLQVAFKSRPPHARLSLDLRYDYPRGWCGHVDLDDRPYASIAFAPDHIIVSRQDMTDCSGNYGDVDTAAAQP